MSESFIIRDLTFGEGIPKICVPLTGRTNQELEEEARASVEAGADLVEWRVDRHREVWDWDAMEETAGSLRGILGELPILFTCRTEDGQFSVGKEEYVGLNKRIIATGLIDLVDVELFMGEEICRELVEYAHEHQTGVIISNHEFQGTPDVEEIVRRMETMEQLGADMPKMAVMPQNKRDVLKLLQATDAYHQKPGHRPAITMSMGNQGVISRISGEIFGSALTFAAIGRGSAPGQISVDKVRTILTILHESC